MKKITLLLFLIFISCDITYDGETRLVSETNIIDRNGNPLSGIEVKIHVTNEFDIDLVSNGVSDANGNTILVFPKPENSHLKISFSNEEFGYETLSFDNIQISDFENYKHKLDKVILLKSNDIALLEINFINTSNGNTVVEDYRIEGITYKDSFSDEDPYENYSELYFNVAKNQVIQLHYTVRDYATATKTEHTASIAIENENVVEIINY